MLAATLLLLIGSPTVELDVAYASVSGEQLKMDVYRPADPKPSMPAVVVIHGGAWISGNKRDMKDLATALAREGFLAASIQYRLAPKHRYPAMIDDARTAVRYLRANAAKMQIDPNRIGAAGASAGGHLALLLGFTDTSAAKDQEYAGHSSKVRAVFDIFGPTDLGRDYSAAFDPVFQMVLGKKRQDAAEEIRLASPVSHVGKGAAPVFILHGTKDAVVPIAQSKLLAQTLADAGVPHETAFIEGLGHEGASKDPKVQADLTAGLARGIAFLKRNLGG